MVSNEPTGPASAGRTFPHSSSTSNTNPQLTTLDPVIGPAHAKTILSEDGFKCSLLTLNPGGETARTKFDHFDEHVFYVVEDEVTVRFESVNISLTKDKALLIPKGKQHVIAAVQGGGAKLLRVEVPPREVVVAAPYLARAIKRSIHVR